MMVVVILTDIEKRPGREDAGVVEGDVETTKTALGLLDEFGDGVRFGNVPRLHLDILAGRPISAATASSFSARDHR